MWRYLAGTLLAATLACSGRSESSDTPGVEPASDGGAKGTQGGAQATSGGVGSSGTGGSPSSGAGDASATGGAGGAPATPAGGGGGAGGDGEALTRVKCSALVGRSDLPPSPFERTEVTGTNGTFIDACDADGNVVEYHCPMQTLCAGGMDCAPYPTGVAAPTTVTCDAGCADGVCVQ